MDAITKVEIITRPHKLDELKEALGLSLEAKARIIGVV